MDDGRQRVRALNPHVGAAGLSLVLAAGLSPGYVTTMRTYTDALPALVKELGVRSLLDAPCGDFNWMRHVDLDGVEYTGGDVVPELVARNRELYGAAGRRFVTLDLTRDPLPPAVAEAPPSPGHLLPLPDNDDRPLAPHSSRAADGFFLALIRKH